MYLDHIHYSLTFSCPHPFTSISRPLPNQPPAVFMSFCGDMSSIRLVHRSLMSLKKMSLQPQQSLTVYKFPGSSEPLTCPSQGVELPNLWSFYALCHNSWFKSTTAMPCLEFSVPCHSPSSFSSYILSASFSKMFPESWRSWWSTCIRLIIYFQHVD